MCFSICFSSVQLADATDLDTRSLSGLSAVIDVGYVFRNAGQILLLRALRLDFPEVLLGGPDEESITDAI